MAGSSNSRRVEFCACPNSTLFSATCFGFYFILTLFYVWATCILISCRLSRLNPRQNQMELMQFYWDHQGLGKELRWVCLQTLLHRVACTESGQSQTRHWPCRHMCVSPVSIWLSIFTKKIDTGLFLYTFSASDIAYTNPMLHLFESIFISKLCFFFVAFATCFSLQRTCHL